MFVAVDSVVNLLQSEPGVYALAHVSFLETRSSILTLRPITAVRKVQMQAD